MQTGTKISGVAHLVVMGVAFFGGAFRSDPLPFEVHEVSVISAADFAAMSATKVPPSVSEQPAAPSPPDPATDSPDITPNADSLPDQAPPAPADQPTADAVPEALPDQPAPEADASDTAPTLIPPTPEVVVLPERPEPRPPPRPVERIAPQPVAPPPPDVKPDEVTTPEVSPDEGAQVDRETQEATAPEEATDQTVTEADEQSSLAPARSVRPQARKPRRPEAPARPATPAAPTVPATPKQPSSSTESAVNDALAEALGGAEPATPVASGPPLTGGEKDVLRVAVQGCWNVGSLSSEALATTVVVGVSLSRDGKPDVGSIRMLSSSGGSAGAAERAFGAARRAIIRCGKNGYDLPADKYGQWRDIEMTFNPERMRIK
ncbi:MAG: hypothetical protein ACI8R4_004026 [Paracoccaceae bacterium]